MTEKTETMETEEAPCCGECDCTEEAPQNEGTQVVADPPMEDSAGGAPEGVSEGGEPPEVAGEVPPDPNLLGQATPQELNSLRSLRSHQDQIAFQIGLEEIRKMQYFAQWKSAEDAMNVTTQEIAKRLKIPREQQFTVGGNGEIYRPPQNISPQVVGEADGGK